MLGVVSVILTLGISYVFNIFSLEVEQTDLLNVMFYSFIAIALIEEVSKWLCGYLFLKENSNFDYMFDGIVYYVFVSLGFATVENILYTVTGGMTTGLIRAVTTVPAHTFFGASMGYYFSLARREKIKGNKSKHDKNLFLSVLVPFLLHGFYDFCLFSGQPILFITYIVFVVSLYVFSIGNIKRMEKIDHELNSENLHCRNCGTIVTANYCTKCGKKIER